MENHETKLYWFEVYGYHRGLGKDKTPTYLSFNYPDPDGEDVCNKYYGDAAYYLEHCKVDYEPIDHLPDDVKIKLIEDIRRQIQELEKRIILIQNS